MRKSFIFSALSILGFGITTALVIKETYKYKDTVDEFVDLMTKEDKTKLIFKTYYPSMISGALTVSSIIASETLSTKQNKTLSQAYILLSQSYTQFRKKVHDSLLTENFDRDELIKDIFDNKVNTVDMAKIPVKNNIDQCLFYDRFSNRYFWRSEDQIIEAEYQLNKLYSKQGYVGLNDFYILLGLAAVHDLRNYGWSSLNYSSSCWIDFDHVLYPLDDDEDLPDFTLIEPFIEPVKDYKYL